MDPWGVHRFQWLCEHMCLCACVCAMPGCVCPHACMSVFTSMLMCIHPFVKLFSVYSVCVCIGMYTHDCNWACMHVLVYVHAHMPICMCLCALFAYG